MSKMGIGIDGVTEPIYFLITAIGFVIVSFINYKKNGKTLETKYLSGLAVFFIVCFIILNFYWLYEMDFPVFFLYRHSFWGTSNFCTI